MKKLLLAMVLILVASCGGSDSVEEAQKKFAKTFCKKIFTCEETVDYQTYLGGTESNCVTFLTTDTEDGEGTDDECKSVNSGKVDECINCYEKLSCEGFAAALQSGEEPCPACDQTCND